MSAPAAKKLCEIFCSTVAECALQGAGLQRDCDVVENNVVTEDIYDTPDGLRLRLTSLQKVKRMLGTARGLGAADCRVQTGRELRTTYKRTTHKRGGKAFSFYAPQNRAKIKIKSKSKIGGLQLGGCNYPAHMPQ